MTLRFVSLILALMVISLPINPCFAAMDYAKQVLIDADFSNRDLKGVTFNLTNLRRANLSGSNLQGASLFGAKLEEADLSNTDLSQATLDSAVFERTDLSNSILKDSFAFNTHFKSVKIDGADFTNVLMGPDEQSFLCSIAVGTNPITGKDTRESLDCL